MKKNYIFLIGISVLLIGLLLYGKKFFQEQHSCECAPEVMVVAHRGAHTVFPENSVPAIQEAVEIGVDLVEIDIRHTKDSVLVLMHDKTLDRTTNGEGLVENYSFREIKKLKLRNPDGSLSEVGIPTLEEVLRIFEDKVSFDLDIKTPLFLPVVEMVEEHSLVESTIFLVYNLEHARMLKQRRKDFNILMRARSEDDLPEIYEILTPEAVHIDDSFNSINTNDIIKNKGGRSFINSLGKIDEEAIQNPVRFQEIYIKGANMIQTNYPEIILRHLRLNGLHN